MGRRLRYQVAMSLDGFIVGPNGDYSWIVMDPAIDFAALFKEFDTAVMGRKTYEVMTAQGGTGAMPGLDVVVFSRTLPAATHPGVRIVSDDPREVVTALSHQVPSEEAYTHRQSVQASSGQKAVHKVTETVGGLTGLSGSLRSPDGQ
jgi:dihydrofolate reductase